MRILLLLLLLTYCFSEDFTTTVIIESEYPVVIVRLYEDWNTGKVQLLFHEEKMTPSQIEKILRRKLNDQDWKFYGMTGKLKIYLEDKTI